MTMAEVWFRIAEAIHDERLSGPWICNIAHRLDLPDWQMDEVLKVVAAERWRQYGGDIYAVYSNSRLLKVLWMDTNDDVLERVLRIRFCTEQIKKAGKR
jgi:hypothetical protein